MTRQPQKTMKAESTEGHSVTINSYFVGPFGEFCAVSKDMGKRTLGTTRIIPLQYVEREPGQA